MSISKLFVKTVTHLISLRSFHITFLHCVIFINPAILAFIEYLVHPACFFRHPGIWVCGLVSCLFSPWERMHSIMNFCPRGAKVQREPQAALHVGREQRSVYLYFKVCVWCVCMCVGIVLTQNTTQSKWNHQTAKKMARKKDSHQCWRPPGSQGWGSGRWWAQPSGKVVEWTWRLHQRLWRWRWSLQGCPPPGCPPSKSPVNQSRWGGWWQVNLRDCLPLLTLGFHSKICKTKLRCLRFCFMLLLLAPCLYASGFLWVSECTVYRTWATVGCRWSCDTNCRPQNTEKLSLSINM